MKKKIASSIVIIVIIIIAFALIQLVHTKKIESIIGWALGYLFGIIAKKILDWIWR